MALSVSRLKEKIKAAWLSEIENEDENEYLDKIAAAVIEEIKEVLITATCTHGAVTIQKIE